MKRLLFALFSMAALFLAGCAGDLTPEDNDKPPAPYAPDPTEHIPQRSDYGTPRI